MPKLHRVKFVRKKEEGYPLSIVNDRTLPEGFDGPVFVWDIDKTYLSTHFSSLGGLSRIPLEFAVDKQAVPGMPAVLRGLRRGFGPEYACVPLYFVSGSPPFLRGVVETRMLMDGVEHDGIIFKDWVKTLRQRRPGRLREQVGYKACALLTGRLERPEAVEYLFGDDVEQDALAFDLYARILEGSLSAGETVQRLMDAGVPGEDRKNLFALLDRLPSHRGHVERIFIHLARNTPPFRFEEYGKRVVPVKSGFQLALALYELSLLDRQTVDQVRQAVFGPEETGQDTAREQTDDALARGLVSRKTLKELERDESSPS
jgi:hypothetical protein